MIEDAPSFHVVSHAVALARRHPVLGTALGCGALEACSPHEDYQRLAVAKLTVGIGLLWWGYYAESLPFLREAEAALTTGIPSVIGEYATWHHLLGQRRFAKIDGIFETMMGIARRIEDSGRLTDAMRCRLDAISGSEPSEENPEPLIILKTVEEYFRQHDLGGDLGIAKTLRSYWLLRHGRLEEGLAQIEEAERLLERADMPTILAWAWFQHGLYHYHKREFQPACHWLDKGIHKAQALRHYYYLATMLQLKAEVQLEEGNLHKSLQTLQDAEAITSELQNGLIDANNLLTAGHIHYLLGNYEAARETYLHSKKIFSGLGYPILASLCDANLGRVATEEGHFGDALHLLQESIPVFEDNEEYEFYALTTQFLAQAYQAFGYQAAAEKRVKEGIAALQEANAQNHSLRLAIYLASMLISQDKAAEAGEWLNQVETLATKEGLKLDAALAMQIRGELLRKNGDFEAAVLAFQQSKITMEELGQTEAAHNSEIGEAETHLSQGDADQAKRILGEMKAGSMRGRLAWRYEVASARAAALQKRSSKALAMYLRAMERIQASRRTLTSETLAEHFVRELRPVFEDSFELAGKLNRPSEQLALAEMYGAQVISVRFGQPTTAEHMLGIEERVRAAMTSELGTGWVVLRYAWQTNDLLWRFLITPDVFEADPIPITNEVREALRLCASPDMSFRQIAYGGNSGDLGQRGLSILYRALLPATLQEYCRPDQPLIIIPSGVLYQLPFHALQKEENHPLIQQAEVSYAASLDLLNASLSVSSPHEWNGASSLVCVETEFNDPQLKGLTYAIPEARLVQEIIGDRAEIRSSSNFRREALEDLDRRGSLQAMRWLHFITHSQYDPYSGAFMGLATREDAIWVEDILRWKTHAELVTLSACQTGIGQAYDGDEINGMIQAFLSGGAQSVIASMWLISDDPNSMSFMGGLYQKMMAGHPPMRALAHVQRQAIEENLPAHQWAQFFLTGRPTPRARSAPQDAPHLVT